MTKHAIEPTPMGDKPHYVYIHFYPEGYIDPEGQDLSGIVFYVGKGTVAQPPVPQRIDMHEAEANNGGSSNERKVKAIQQIWAAGKSVGKRIIFETWDEDEAYRVEGETIEQHTGPYLTNRQVKFPRRAHAPVRVGDVADQLREQILAGEFGKGRLPAGEDLADQYCTSRDTIHRAMRLLQAEGLLIGKGKRGMVINHQQRISIPASLPLDLALQSIGQAVVETQLGKMLVVPAPAKIAHALSLEEGVPVVHQVLRRGTATMHYQLADIFYPEAFVPRRDEETRKGAAHIKRGVSMEAVKAAAERYAFDLHRVAGKYFVLCDWYLALVAMFDDTEESYRQAVAWMQREKE